jgi:hypothetical protein
LWVFEENEPFLLAAAIGVEVFEIESGEIVAFTEGANMPDYRKSLGLFAAVSVNTGRAYMSYCDNDEFVKALGLIATFQRSSGAGYQVEAVRQYNGKLYLRFEANTAEELPYLRRQMDEAYELINTFRDRITVIGAPK